MVVERIRFHRRFLPECHISTCIDIHKHTRLCTPAYPSPQMSLYSRSTTINTHTPLNPWCSSENHRWAQSGALTYRRHQERDDGYTENEGIRKSNARFRVIRFITSIRLCIYNFAVHIHIHIFCAKMECWLMGSSIYCKLLLKCVLGIQCLWAEFSKTGLRFGKLSYISINMYKVYISVLRHIIYVESDFHVVKILE